MSLSSIVPNPSFEQRHDPCQHLIQNFHRQGIHLPASSRNDVEHARLTISPRTPGLDSAIWDHPLHCRELPTCRANYLQGEPCMTEKSTAQPGSDPARVRASILRCCAARLPFCTGRKGENAPPGGNAPHPLPPWELLLRPLDSCNPFIINNVEIAPINRSVINTAGFQPIFDRKMTSFASLLAQFRAGIPCASQARPVFRFLALVGDTGNPITPDSNMQLALR